MSDAAPRLWAVVPAAGVGSRMASDIPKQYLQLGGRMVIEHSLNRLLQHPRIHGAVVVLGANDEYWSRVRLDVEKPLLQVAGGAERCDSVLNGMTALVREADTLGCDPDNDWVLVHDAARPCVRQDDISRLIDRCLAQGVGGLLALPVRDTMKRQDTEGCVQATVDRNGLWHALTPQMFRLNMLRNALESALTQKQQVTDESSAMELAGYRPLLVEGHEDNIKITRLADLRLAELYLCEQDRCGDK